MEKKGKKNWWFLVVNGLIAILFGIFLLFFDKDLMKVIVIYLGIAFIIAGVFMLITGIRNIKAEKQAGVQLVQSILTLIIGLIVVLFPTFSLKLVLIIIGVWAVILGIAQLVILISIKEHMSSKTVLLFNGILTIVMGILLFFDPIATTGFLLKIIGVFAIIFGILMIYFGIVLKMLKSAVEETAPSPELNK